MTGRQDVRFGDFVLNRARGRLEDRSGGERFLRPKSFRVLELLCERRGALVGKDELIRLAWPDVIVSDDSLAHCISDIRRALGPEGSGLLRTVPRRGYMLDDAPIVPRPVAGEGAAAPGWRSLSLTVLLTACLASSTEAPAPDAVSRSAVGMELQQALILLETRDWQRRENNEKARQLLEGVLAADPHNPDALAALAVTYWLEVQHLSWGGGRREMTLALDLAGRAAAAGENARALRLLAEMRLLSPFPEHRSAADALAMARAAAALDPRGEDTSAVLVQVLALTGRAGDAVGVIEDRLRLRPTSPDWHRQAVGLAFLLHDMPARAAEALGPVHGAGTFTSVRWWPGWLFAASLAHAGRVEEAVNVVESARQRRPERNLSAVAQSLEGLVEGDGLALILAGLRLAGMRG